MVFKEGDKVKLLVRGDKFPLNGFSNGKEYIVVDVNYESHEFFEGKCVELVNEYGHSGYAKSEWLEKTNNIRKESVEI